MKIEYDKWMREAENYIAKGEDEIRKAMERKELNQGYKVKTPILKELRDLSKLAA